MEDLHTEALELWAGAEAKAAGIVFLNPGFHDFVLENGARLRVYATPCTPYPTGVDGSEWAFGYSSSQDTYNPPETGIWYSNSDERKEMILTDGKRGQVEILISHGPPRHRLDRTEEGDNVGCKNLFRAVRRIRPRVHAFGHVQASHGAERVTWKEEGELPKDDDVDDGVAGVQKYAGVVGGNNVLRLRRGRLKKRCLLMLRLWERMD
ncbi:hypothetical protein N431DRAFT_446052 [Stipitochalara longipes BDJ]|nr:hypothetical protein N431DRAFT_446052 [Stipitochalara longipes BDJ]